MSQHYDKMHLVSAGIDQNNSTLNDGGQFFTLAKTGILNNLNLSQLLKSNNNILEEDGIEDLHFYFVSFNIHKTKVLQKYENSKWRKNKIERGKQAGKAHQAHKKPDTSKEQTKTIESVSEEELD